MWQCSQNAGGTHFSVTAVVSKMTAEGFCWHVYSEILCRAELWTLVTYNLTARKKKKQGFLKESCVLLCISSVQRTHGNFLFILITSQFLLLCAFLWSSKYLSSCEHSSFWKNVWCCRRYVCLSAQWQGDDHCYQTSKPSLSQRYPVVDSRSSLCLAVAWEHGACSLLACCSKMMWVCRTALMTAGCGNFRVPLERLWFRRFLSSWMSRCSDVIFIVKYWQGSFFNAVWAQKPVIQYRLLATHFTGRLLLPLKQRGFALFPTTSSKLSSDPSALTHGSTVTLFLLCLPSWQRRPFISRVFDGSIS